MNPTSFDLATAISNLSAAFGSIQSLIFAVSYVIGVALFVKGIMMFKIFATQSFASAQRGEVGAPLVHILIGALLLYFPTTVDTSLSTVFGSNTVGSASQLMAYQSLSGIQQWQGLADVIIDYTKLVGLIAFIRGWVLITKTGHHGGGQATLGKGILHIVGGILLINIVDTFSILATTFGYQ